MATTHTSPQSFGERMKAARDAADLSTMNAAYAIRALLPEPLWISNDPIRRMENGKVTEEKADPLLVCALAAVYGVEVRSLSPKIADSLGLVDRLLHETGREEVDEQGNRLSIWNTGAYRAVREHWRSYDVPLFTAPRRRSAAAA